MPDATVPTGPTPRTALGRNRERGSYERADVDAILDAALVCHVATQVDAGTVALPMAFARAGDEVFIHGSPAAGMLRALRGACRHASRPRSSTASCSHARDSTTR